MKAVVKSKLLVKFDEAIQYNKNFGNLIKYFQLESEVEDNLFFQWIIQCGQAVDLKTIYEYNGIEIRLFCPYFCPYVEETDTKNWKYDVNPEMDKHAEANDLGHWCCVSVASNKWWIRVDGKECEPAFKGVNGYLDDLRSFDKKYPMEEK